MTATAEAPATEAPATTGRQRAPKQPDPDAPKRRAYIKQVFDEAGEGNAASAIRKLLDQNAGKAKGEGTTFKSQDFAEVGGRPTFCDYRIQWHRDKISDLERSKAGVKTVKPEKAQKRLEKIGKDLLGLEALLRSQGVDVEKIRSALAIKIG